MQVFKQAQEERLRFIDFSLLYFGVMDRMKIVNRFGISHPAATKDLALYKELKPKNMVYDPGLKKYFMWEETFSPYFEFDPMLTERILFDGIYVSFLPVYGGGIGERMPKICKENFAILPFFTRAISLEKPLRINYYSFNTGKRISRVIVPHKLVDTGHRWHVRAFDRMNDRFSDFVLARASEPEILEEEIRSSERKEKDYDWNETATLRLIPHPRSENREGVAMQYGFSGGSTDFSTRLAYKHYYLLENVIDNSPEADKDPKRYHLTVEKEVS